MGLCLNPGSVLFQESLDSEIYVDKTELIHFTNRILHTEQKFVCVSRPRRFGKSMALKMLAAYYSKGHDSVEQFERLKVSQFDLPKDAKKKVRFERNRNQYDVLLVDMQGILGMAIEEEEFRVQYGKFMDMFPKLSEEDLKKMLHPLLVAVQRWIIRDMRENEEYARIISEYESSLGNAMLTIYKKTGSRFVLLIDEWDCIFRNYEKDKFLQNQYIDWLRDMFKNTARLPMYAMVYMTGILPIKRYGTQSALNNFKEYTMLSMAPLEEFAGFTEKEALSLYEEYDMSTEKAKEWYDGYQLEEFGHIYNPNSVVESISRRKFKNYWVATGVYETVKKPIEMNFDGLKEKVIRMLAGEPCKVNTSMFNNTMTDFDSADDVFTFLVHLGYLGYDVEHKEVYIPNKEIKDEFVNAISGDKYRYTYEAVQASDELLMYTLEGDEERVAACVEKVHQEHTSIITYNNENSMACILHIAYYKAQDGYKMIREMPAGKGFCDIAFLPRPGIAKPAILLELKWKKDVITAMDQIKNRQYSEWLKDYSGEVVLVGIAYEKEGEEHKHHTCKIERIIKE